MQQAQQPFKCKNTGRFVGVLGQVAGFRDDQFGPARCAPDADGKVGQDQAQEAAGASQCLGQGRGTQAGTAEKFEAADPHRLGKKAECFVVHAPVEQIVECGILRYRNSAGRVCNINPCGEQ